MKLDDIIALAKQGYKPADIKELYLLGNEKEPEDDTQEDKESMKASREDDDPEKSADHDRPEGEAGNVDYKKLYEEQKKTLEKLQADNRKKDHSEKSEADFMKEFEDIARSFM